jgi:hypothetical protein
VRATTAGVGPIPPSSGTVCNSPKIARLGIVCTALAAPSTNRAHRGRCRITTPQTQRNRQRQRHRQRHQQQMLTAALEDFAEEGGVMLLRWMEPEPKAKLIVGTRAPTDPGSLFKLALFQHCCHRGNNRVLGEIGKQYCIINSKECTVATLPSRAPLGKKG